MSNVIDFMERKGHQVDNDARKWLWEHGMDDSTIDLLQDAFVQMNRLCNEPHPEAGAFSGICFQRHRIHGSLVWHIGYDKIYPVQIVHEHDPLSSKDIEYLYHSREHGFSMSSVPPDDVGYVERHMFNCLSRVDGLVDDTIISPFLYFVREGIRLTFEQMRARMVLSGYNAEEKVYMVILQGDRERFHWTFHFSKFLDLPVTGGLRTAL